MITQTDTARERRRRRIGRPAKAEAYRERVRAWLAEEPGLMSLELHTLIVTENR